MLHVRGRIGHTANACYTPPEQQRDSPVPNPLGRHLNAETRSSRLLVEYFKPEGEDFGDQEREKKFLPFEHLHILSKQRGNVERAQPFPPPVDVPVPAIGGPVSEASDARQKQRPQQAYDPPLDVPLAEHMLPILQGRIGVMQTKYRERHQMASCWKPSITSALLMLSFVDSTTKR